jgi:hypothetical protein
LVLVVLWSPEGPGSQLFPFTRAHGTVAIKEDDEEDRRKREAFRIVSLARAEDAAIAIVDRRSLFGTAAPKESKLSNVEGSSLMMPHDAEIETMARKMLALEMRKNITSVVDTNAQSPAPYMARPQHKKKKSANFLNGGSSSSTRNTGGSQDHRELQETDEPQREFNVRSPSPLAERVGNTRPPLLQSSSPSPSAAASEANADYNNDNFEDEVFEDDFEDESAAGASTEGEAAAATKSEVESKIASLTSMHVNLEDEQPKPEVAPPLTGDVRGMCGKCNEPVYGSQERDKDGQGIYYHANQEDCSTDA